MDRLTLINICALNIRIKGQCSQTCIRTPTVSGYPFNFAVCLFCSVNPNHCTAASAAGAATDGSLGIH